MDRQMLFTVWCVLTSSFLNPTDSELQLVVSPNAIGVDFTRSLEVNCTFSPTSPTNLSYLISLAVSKVEDDQNGSPLFQDLASIHEFVPDQVNTFPQLNASVSGLISTGKTSYLSLQWEYPDQSVAGMYRCKALGLDRFGHPVEEEHTQQVTSSKPGIDQLIEVIKLQQKQMDNMMKVLASLNISLADVSVLTIEVSTLTNNVSTLTNNVSTLTNNVSTLNNNFSTLTNNFSTLSNNFSTLTNNFSTLTNNVSTLTNNVSTLNNNFSTLANNVSTLNNNFSTLTNNFSTLSNTLTSNFSTLTNNVSTLTNNVSTLNNNFSTLTNNFSTLSNTLTSNFSTLTNKVSTLSSDVNELNDEVKDLNTTQDILLTTLSKFYIKSSNHQGRYYLLSKEDADTNRMAQASCLLQGGYLAEINDVSEHNFIKTFLRSSAPSRIIYVLVGATEIEHPGTWVFSHSRQVVNYTGWGAGEPNTVDRTCMILYRDGGWFMYDFYCSYYGSVYSFLCEIPIV